MKRNALLFFVFISFLFFAFSNGHHNRDSIMRIGCTQLNGTGCVCHNLQSDSSVHVWVKGPDTLASGQTALYRAYLSGGPAISGGYNVASRFGSLDTVGILSDLVVGELTQAFPQLFPSPTDTINWPFLYTAPDSVNMDTIYSVALSSNNDGNPSIGDVWNFGPKFPVTILENATPVELISFYANRQGNEVTLNWTTASELNNKGFFVERSTDNKNWKSLSFVKGDGTTTEKHSYTYKDRLESSSAYYYRLKQIDYSGKFTTSKTVKVKNDNLLNSFALEQNYPNPFNPTTNIEFQIEKFGFVSLKIYDALGREVATLVNEEKPAGNYEVQFDASKLTSGIYFYKITSGKFSQVKKMILMK